MIKQFKITPLLIALLIMAFASCKKEMDKYYERPSSLAPPIYQQLQTMGRFTHYLKLVDKAGFKDVLDRTGYVTVFAPNDSAFEAYFTQNGLSENNIDSIKARQIITYMLLYNGYRTTDFDRYQAGPASMDSSAFKRKTYYYKGFFDANIIENGAPLAVAAFDYGSNLNNKYIPIFTKAFFLFNNLNATDYTYFFPNSAFTGLNVASAKIIKGDMLAENGYIQEVNKVIEPLPDLEECIAADPKYSKFKQLMDTFVSYVYDANLTATYQKFAPNSANIKAYYKNYLKPDPNTHLAVNWLPFWPNNEFDIQSTVNTMFVPTNDAFDKMMKERIAFYVKDQDYRNLPLSTLANFVKVHMFAGSVWPSQLGAVTNFNEEPPRFNLAANVVDKQFGSNGIFYGTNIAQYSDLFMSVYGDVYLNPGASMYLYGVGLNNMQKTISSPANRYSLFIVTDSLFNTMGFDYISDRTSSPLYYKSSPATAANLTTFQGVMGLHTTDEVADISGKGVVEGYYGDIIGYDNGKLFTAWNLETNRYVKCKAIPNSIPNNGTVYYCDTALKLTSYNILYHVKKYFSTTKYWNYVKFNKNCDTVAFTIGGIKANVLYTMLIPDDNAINEAIANGDLPGDPKTGDQDKIKRFILLHIIKEKSIIANGKRNANGGFLTLLSLGTGSAAVTVTNTVNNLSFTDMKGKTIDWDPNNSNVLSNKAVIHTVKGYLQY